ncbi:unnamed protein product [Meloidogyne enterolobii]|uniref:Uncharacterized protein n=1 Tax=Meloidogyne enterolobii TaxID=390850 RepID=A0ACB1A8V6_MELEN
MPYKVKREPNSPKNGGGDIDEGEDLVLDFVEEAGDELEESDRIPSPRSMSAPHSPDAREEVLQADAEEDSSENEKKLKNNKQMGPKTPPGNEEEEDDKMDDTKSDGRDDSLSDLNDSRDRKRRRRSSSTSSRSRSRSSRSRSSRSRRSSNSSDVDRSPPQKYRQTRRRDRDDDYVSVEERLRQNRKARLVRLRDARSRHLGYTYVPRMGGKPGFPPQPYFKNPSYYPTDDSRDNKTKKTPNPPPLAQKIEPLPGGRLPLVQRRSSPAPFDRSSSSGGGGRRSPGSGGRRSSRSPTPTYHHRSGAPPRRVARGIVEEVFTVRASGRSSPTSHHHYSSSGSTRRSSRSPQPLNRYNPSNYYRRSSTYIKNNLGPQTLYPSRRNPYPPPKYERGWGGNYRGGGGRSYYNNGGNYRGSGGSSSSYRERRGGDSNGGQYIYTGSKYVPRPWIPPPPPGKKWNCPRRDEPYVPSSRKCPKRDDDKDEGDDSSS